jgi:hypothetical protein
VRALYPTSRWYGEWWDGLRADASRGEVVDRRALDRLEPLHRHVILHDWPRSVPAGYVLPEAR